MTRRRLAVVSGGLRQPSSTRLLADQLASAARIALEEKGIEVELLDVELRDHAHDLTNNLLTGFPSAPLRRVVDSVTSADGLVAVTPIFNASYGGLFKTFFDVLDEHALAGMPVVVGATGGTARHSLVLDHALRPMFSYLKSVVVPTGVFAAAEDWGAGSTGEALAARVDRAGRELATVVADREPATAADPFELTTSFERLLSG